MAAKKAAATPSTRRTKTAMWFQFHPENGGLVRVNVHTHEGAGKMRTRLTAADVDIPFDDLSSDEQELVLDAFATLAGHVGATPAEITALATPPEELDDA